MKKVFVILALCLALLVATIAIAAWLSWQPQSWYTPPDASQPEVATLAQRAEYRLNEEFHKIRPVDEIWKIRINDKFMNAWLATRLEGWLTHDQDLEMPPELHNPYVHVTTEGLWIGAMVEIDGDAPRPVAMQIAVNIENRMIRLEPRAIRLGKIPLPVSIFTQAVEEMQEEVFAIEAIAPLMDDREVEIISITLEDGALVLACKTILPN